MKITYIGHSSFKVEIDKTAIVIDPYDPKSFGYDFPETKADILLLSHNDKETTYTKGVVGNEFTIDSPGEYEMGGIFIYGLPTYHDAKEGSDLGKNTAYLIDNGDFSILHLGSLGHELPQKTLEKVGDVDVLMIPVGGNYVIDAELATKVISSIEPGFVVPMHYDTKDSKYDKKLAKLEAFLKEMGAEDDVKQKSELNLSSTSRVPDETEVLVLKPQH
ncbi:MBL fold metallo-hydrolase [candidate division WWE3 bacterium]|nr:MBL fold metallo-hydrolase [candidate division WWE3 bacterium]